MRVHKHISEAAQKSRRMVWFNLRSAQTPAPPYSSNEEALTSCSRFGESSCLLEQLDFGSGVSGAVSFSAEQSDEADHAAQRRFHRVPPAVGQVFWELLNQRAGALTPQATETEMPVDQLNAEQQVVHSALQKGANSSFGPEAECHI